MAKLIVRLPDGTPRSCALDRDRVTIGRRVDNDLCLSYPAVSAEHAVVITIGGDSFLEDLGSTNGTLVNGERVAKHFLRDGDVIDVGRLAITYVAHDDAGIAEPSTGDEEEDAAPSSADGAEGAAPSSPAEEDGIVPSPELSTDAPSGDAADEVPTASAVEAIAGTSPEQARPAEESVPISDPEEAADEEAAPADELLADLMESRSTATAALDLAPTLTVVRSDRANGDAARMNAAPVSGTPPVDARITILSGPHAGETTPMNKAQFVFGRPGVSVAAIRRSGGAYRLVALAGESLPVVNGGAVGRAGAELAFGDTIEVAGVTLRFERRM